MDYVVYETGSTKIVPCKSDKVTYSSTQACKVAITKLVNAGTYKESELDFCDYAYYALYVEKKLFIQNEYGVFVKKNINDT